MYKRMLRSALAASFVAALGFGLLGGGDIGWSSEATDGPGDIGWVAPVVAAGDIGWVAPAVASGDIGWASPAGIGWSAPA